MKLFLPVTALIAAISTQPVVLADESGTLTPEFLGGLRKAYEMDDADRAIHNAVTNNPLNALALNREVIRGDDGNFSHRVKSRGITNQRKSGRCWMFAALNVMRPKVIREYRMPEFEFSTSYLQFWDKLEKSNLYLESVIELRDADFLDRDWEVVNKWALGDGGWWNYATGLIEKYGVVPSTVMPETQVSENTATLNHILGRLLRARAAGMLALHEQGAGIDALRSRKQDTLREVYRLLAINLGEPPAEFEWRHRVRKTRGETPDDRDPAQDMEEVAEKDLTPAVRYTPLSFYRKFVGTALHDYVCFYHDPRNELGRHYRFERAHNIIEKECMHFVNIDIETMKRIAVSSILANEPLWFAADVKIDQSRELGLMQHDLYDYGALFGIDIQLGKADRIRFHAGASNHAMALMGVDLIDGTPRKWLVENSWGDDKGNQGTWTLYDRWFDEHVYTITAHKRHVPAGIMKHFKQEPQDLPCWYPSARGAAQKSF